MNDYTRLHHSNGKKKNGAKLTREGPRPHDSP